MNTINLINGSMTPSILQDPLQRLTADQVPDRKATAQSFFRHSLDFPARETTKVLKGFVSRQKGQRVGNTAFLRLSLEPRKRHLIVGKNDAGAILVKHPEVVAKTSPKVWDCRSLFRPPQYGHKTMSI